VLYFRRGGPEFEDAEVDTLTNPTLVVEVLSKSTASYDRNEKTAYYRTLPSLAEYVIVSQDEYHVTQYVKQEDGRRLLSDIRGKDASVELTSVGCTLAMSEIYERVAAK
jgi:Uma2 family endonuclease